MKRPPLSDVAMAIAIAAFLCAPLAWHWIAAAVRWSLF